MQKKNVSDQINKPNTPLSKCLELKTVNTPSWLDYKFKGMKQNHLKIQFTYNPISVLLSRVDSFKTVQYTGNEHDRMPPLST